MRRIITNTTANTDIITITAALDAPCPGSEFKVGVEELLVSSLVGTATELFVIITITAALDSPCPGSEFKVGIEELLVSSLVWTAAELFVIQFVVCWVADLITSSELGP